MLIEIIGFNPPGRTCNPASDHGPYDDIQVGVGNWKAPVALFPGDATNPRWRIEVRVVPGPAGVDFRGREVEGRRGARFVYLNWLAKEPDGHRMFRRGKIGLGDIPAALIESGADLSCTVNLTDPKGDPNIGHLKEVGQWALLEAL